MRDLQPYQQHGVLGNPDLMAAVAPHLAEMEFRRLLALAQIMIDQQNVRQLAFLYDQTISTIDRLTAANSQGTDELKAQLVQLAQAMFHADTNLLGAQHRAGMATLQTARLSKPQPDPKPTAKPSALDEFMDGVSLGHWQQLKAAWKG